MSGGEAPLPAAEKPCITCPWLTANHGRRHPDGWFTLRNRRRLWAGLRRGESMSCHPTDPNNEVTDRAQAAGYRPAPAHARVRECTGALILQQREMDLLQGLTREHPDGAVRVYRRMRPMGLLREGIGTLLQRMVLGGTPMGGTAMARPDLNQPVGHPALPWTSTPEETSP